MLPDNASHQVGVGSFVINENNEVNCDTNFLPVKDIFFL